MSELQQKQHEELIHRMRIDTRINAILAAAAIASLIVVIFRSIK